MSKQAGLTNSSAELEKIKTLRRWFDELASLAWENVPDADPEYMEDFRERMEVVEREGNRIFDELLDKTERADDDASNPSAEESAGEQPDPSPENLYTKTPLEIDPVMEIFLEKEGITNVQEGHLYLTGAQISRMTDSGMIGKSIRNPEIRTMYIPSKYGPTLIFEHKHWTEVARPLVSGHGSSRFFHCGKCRKGLCDWHDYGKVEECPFCRTVVAWH